MAPTQRPTQRPDLARWHRLLDDVGERMRNPLE